MSGFEDEPRIGGIPPIIIDKSKVELSRNAKGDPQWRIVVVEDSTANIDELRSIAVQQYAALERELLGIDRSST